MKMKKTTNLLVIYALVTTFLFLFNSCKEKEYTDASSDKYRLVWNDDPSSTITIIWDQMKGENAIVYYGKDDFGKDYSKYPLSQAPTRKLLDYYDMNTYYAEIKSLEPDQNYYFVIKDEFGVSNRYYFRTAPDTPKAFRNILNPEINAVNNM